MHARQEKDACIFWRCAIKHLQIRLEDAEYVMVEERAKIACGGNLQRAGKEALIAWATPSDIATTNIRPEDRQFAEAFLDLLQHGSRPHREAVLASLKVFMNNEWPALKERRAGKKRKAG